MFQNLTWPQTVWRRKTICIHTKTPTIPATLSLISTSNPWGRQGWLTIHALLMTKRMAVRVTLMSRCLPRSWILSCSWSLSHRIIHASVFGVSIFSLELGLFAFLALSPGCGTVPGTGKGSKSLEWIIVLVTLTPYSKSKSWVLLWLPLQMRNWGKDGWAVI